MKTHTNPANHCDCRNCQGATCACGCQASSTMPVEAGCQCGCQSGQPCRCGTGCA